MRWIRFSCSNFRAKVDASRIWTQMGRENSIRVDAGKGQESCSFSGRTTSTSQIPAQLRMLPFHPAFSRNSSSRSASFCTLNHRTMRQTGVASCNVFMVSRSLYGSSQGRDPTKWASPPGSGLGMFNGARSSREHARHRRQFDWASSTGPVGATTRPVAGSALPGLEELTCSWARPKYFFPCR